MEMNNPKMVSKNKIIDENNVDIADGLIIEQRVNTGKIHEVINAQKIVVKNERQTVIFDNYFYEKV